MGAQELSSLSHIGIIFYRIFLFIRPKLKKCLFPAPDWTLRLEIFFFWLLEIVTGSSDFVPEFTFGTGLHFQMNKIRCLTLKEPDLWMNAVYFGKKKKSPYLPTHRWNGGSGAWSEHIFKGGPVTSSFLKHNWCKNTELEVTTHFLL